MSQQFKLMALNEQYAEQAAVILAKAFMEEPMQTVLDTTLEDNLEFMRHVVRHSIPTGLSVMAIDTTTDQVVGVNINKDLLEEPIGAEDSFSDKLLPIFELLDQLDQEFHKRYKVQANEVHHNLMMATDTNYRNNDLSSGFMKLCTDIAREKGFKTMLAEVTGPISFHITTQKLGFEEVYAIKYANFCFNGNYPFKGIKNAEYCHLVQRPIPKG